MPNRARHYMDRLLGRNEGSESRDFTDGTKYGEPQRYFDDEYNDEKDDTFQRRFPRSQAARTRPRPDYYKSDYERDYSVRNRHQGERDYMNYSRSENADYSSFRDDKFYSERDRGHYGKGPKNWKISDDRIKDQVSEALYRDYHVDASDIDVDVKDGVVTLTGTVKSREEKRSAEESIENLSGVIDVHNRIRIMEKNNVTDIKGSLS